MADLKHADMDGIMTDGITTAAMAWRVKYRKYDDSGKVMRKNCRSGSLGSHKNNRGGVYASGLRCKRMVCGRNRNWVRKIRVYNESRRRGRSSIECPPQSRVIL